MKLQMIQIFIECRIIVGGASVCVCVSMCTCMCRVLWVCVEMVVRVLRVSVVCVLRVLCFGVVVLCCVVMCGVGAGVGAQHVVCGVCAYGVWRHLARGKPPCVSSKRLCV